MTDAPTSRALMAAALAVVLAACSGGRGRPAAGLPDEAVALNNRGVGLMGQFEYGQARDVFARLADGHPGRPDLQTNLGIAALHRQQNGDADEARRIFERVLAADPDNLRAHYNLGLLLLHDGHASEALPHFARVTERDPSDAYAWYFAAQCRFQEADFEGALTSYERALALNPRLRSAAYGAFQSMQRLGRPDAPRRLDTFKALERSPQSETAEFKYTRLGPLAEAATIDAPARPTAPGPSGSVFERSPVVIAASETVSWRRFPAHRAGAASPPVSITAADVDGDGQIDLFVAGGIDDGGVGRNALLLNRGAEGFVLDRAHPLAAVADVQAALWGDYDNDGLTDVYLCRRGTNQLWRQTAKGRWSNVTAAAKAGRGGGITIDGAMFDADHDGDLDLLLVKSSGANELLNNDGDGTFRPIGAAAGLAADSRPSRGVVVADFDADRDADILVVKESPPHVARANDRAWRYGADSAFDPIVRAPVSAAVAGDLDADGYPELYASDGGGVRRWTRSAAGPWESRSVTGTQELAGAGQLALADLDGDGRLDLVGTGADGRWRALAISDAGDASSMFAADGPALAGWTLAVLDATRGPSIVAMPGTGGPPLLWQPGAGRFAFVSVSLSGRDPRSRQMRSNASGVGTKMAARIGSRWTALTTYRSQSGVGQSLQPVAFGLGGSPQIDFVSLTWSDGVFQSELALEPGGVRQIAETERQLSSCPVLFAYDGKRFAFVTDVLGVGGIGTPVKPGVYASPRPRENVLIPEGLPVARNGRLALKLTEPMEEVAYVDAARLVAYDVPPGWQLVLDERQATSDPEATGEPRFYRDERLPIRATSDDGAGTADVTQAVAAADGVAAPAGRADPRHIGRTDEHVITLQFERALDEHAAGEPTLVADGWLEYPYAQTLFASWQAGAEYRAPTIEARGADGGWRVLRREFGYPAGMPRRMSVPLGRLPAGTTQLRLRTTQEIYWDRLAIAYAESCPMATRHELSLASARLALSGFARRDMHAGRRPSYDYGRRAPFADTRHPSGLYTAEGPVTDLIAGEDGAVAIFGPGEELHLEFAAPQSAPAPGWTRRYVLEARGWCKDMDLYTKDGETVEPVPGLRSAAAEDLQRRYTTRYESGR